MSACTTSLPERRATSQRLFRMEQVDGVFATELGALQIFLRMGAACLLAGIIGVEREIRDRPAGLRTFMLVSLASCLFTIIALEVSYMFETGNDESSVRPDPLRIIEAVTAGVAFIAAGAIIRHGARLEGLTTGAGLWLAGATGLACGAGFIAIAALVSILALVILTVFHLIEASLPIVQSRDRADRKADSGSDEA